MVLFHAWVATVHTVLVIWLWHRVLIRIALASHRVRSLRAIPFLVIHVSGMLNIFYWHISAVERKAVFLFRLLNTIKKNSETMFLPVRYWWDEFCQRRWRSKSVDDNDTLIFYAFSPFQGFNWLFMLHLFLFAHFFCFSFL